MPSQIKQLASYRASSLTVERYLISQGWQKDEYLFRHPALFYPCSVQKAVAIQYEYETFYQYPVEIIRICTKENLDRVHKDQLAKAPNGEAYVHPFAYLWPTTAMYPYPRFHVTPLMRKRLNKWRQTGGAAISGQRRH